MATTNTISITATNTAWALVADGADVAVISVQVDPTTPSAYLAISQGSPNVNSNDYIVLQRERDTSLTVNLNTGDQVYAKSASQAPATVRAVLGGR